VGGKDGAGHKNDLLQAKDADLARFAGIKDDLRRTYAAMAACMDENAGRVLDALETSGAASNTIVLFLSDNGGSLPWGGTNGALKGQKGQYYEGGIRTPLLMRWPGHFQAGRTVDEPVVSVDLFPTLLGFAGGSTGGLTLDGIDIRPLLAGEKKLPERDFYWANALRRGDWKFVLNKGKGKAELFNLKNDPGETKDLSDQNPELFNELQKAHEAMAASVKKKP
jgi:arylsulfatase A-like enzyme